MTDYNSGLEVVLMGSRFPLGQVVATSNVLAWAESHGVDLAPFLVRHAAADWGDLCESDREQNDQALDTGEARLFSSYEIPEVAGCKVWIITEWDRSVTTILLPEDY